MKAFVIDLKKCVGCRSCQVGCKDEHCSNEWLPYAKVQPWSGQFWMHVTEEERGAIPHVKVTYFPLMCQHCGNAKCLEACACGAIYRRDDGIVVIDPERCDGCGACAEACPFGTIFMNDELKIAQKCTGCSHLVDDPDQPIHVPRCVDNCPVDAIEWGEEEDLDLANVEVYKPELGSAPRVFYRNLPKKFVAGLVYDPIEKEVVIGAKCTLTGDGGTFEAMTDNFGDFWLRGLPEGDWTLTIEAAGKSKIIECSTKQKDCGLGEIPLA